MLISPNIAKKFRVRRSVINFMPPSKKEGHIALHVSVGRYDGIP